MPQQQSIENRLASLEKEVTELKQELAKRRTLEGLRTDVQELQVRYQAHEEYIKDRLDTFENHITVRLDVAEDNNNARFQELQVGQNELHASQQKLQVGQQQILDILLGKTKRND